MDFLLEALTNWLKEMLVGGIMSNLSGMFDSVNQQVADISVEYDRKFRNFWGSTKAVRRFPESSRSSDFCCRRCLFLIGLTWYQQA